MNRKYHYQIRKDVKVLEEEAREYIAYGIEAKELCANGAEGTVVACVEDIFLEEEAARALADLCNELELDPLHLYDVAEDAIG